MKSPVAVLYDRENNWAIQDAQGPRNENMFYTEAVQKQYRALREQGLNVDVISMEHELSGYKIVAAPMAYMFKDGYEEKLRAYAENGGTLVITYWTGLVDGTDKCFLGGTPYGLMEAAGLRTTAVSYTHLMHPYELPQIHYTVVRVAKGQMGIAGDDSWGARTQEEYLLDTSKPMEFSFVFKGI